MLTITGKKHGEPKQTNKGFIQQVLTENDLIKVFAKSLDQIKPDAQGMIKIPVQAKDNFVFAL